MWLLLITSLLLAGIACILVGCRGRTIRHAPACRRCSYELAALPNAPVCPECGAGLLDGRGVATFQRRRHKPLIGIGAILLGAGVVMLGVTLFALASGQGAVRMLPWWHLSAYASDHERDTDRRDELIARITSGRADSAQLDSLSKRLTTTPLDDASLCVTALTRSPSLSPAAAQGLADWILTRQTDRSLPWEEWMGAAFERMHARNLLSGAQTQSYVAAMCDPVAMIQYAGPLHVNARLPVLVDPRTRATRETARHIAATLTSPESCAVSAPDVVNMPLEPYWDGAGFRPAGYVQPLAHSASLAVECSLRNPDDPKSNYPALYLSARPHRWNTTLTLQAVDPPASPSPLDKLRDALAMMLTIPEAGQIATRLGRRAPIELRVAISCPEGIVADPADLAKLAGTMRQVDAKGGLPDSKQITSVTLAAGMRQGSTDWWFDELTVNVPITGMLTDAEWNLAEGRWDTEALKRFAATTTRPRTWVPGAPTTLVLRVLEFRGSFTGHPAEPIEVIYHVDPRP